MIVTTVYTAHNGGKGGTCYTEEWVDKLLAGVAGNIVGQFRWRPLTDDNLEHGWPGWWAKIELFKPGQFDEPVLYLDLDTLVVGDLSDIVAHDHEFTVLDDVYRPGMVQSSVMKWTPSEITEGIYTRFIEKPEMYMRSFRSDQEFIQDTLGWSLDPARWQVVLPGQVVSLKKHARRGPPDDARLVCAHGEPRLSNANADWAHVAWASL